MADDAWSMQRYDGSHRALVVVAPAAGDARVAAVRRAVAEHAGGFADRDMVLIEAWPGGGTADGESLTAEQSAGLRERLDVADGAFAVLLVGKDTTVKRRDDSPPDLQDIFDLIDTMPMRQREMRERGRYHDGV
jgi:hypothetical protein